MNDNVAAFLATVRDKCREEQEKMRANGFVIDNLNDRWQKLAFTFYSDIAEMSMRAGQLLDEGGEQDEVPQDACGH